MTKQPVPIQFWRPTPVKPQLLLAQLRAAVFARSEKRSPKWKFRVALDLALLIQPRLSEKLAEKFECCAIQRAGADESLFAMRLKDLSRLETDYWRLGFDLYAFDAETWHLKPRLIHRGRIGELAEFRQRVVGAFEGGCFDRLRPDSMLGHSCLICGKGLSDPVSRARGIGPECWGSGSATLPFFTNLMGEDHAGHSQP